TGRRYFEDRPVPGEEIRGRFGSAESAPVKVTVLALDQRIRQTSVRATGKCVENREDAGRGKPEKYSGVMHAGWMIEKSPARITGRSPVKISVGALHERGGVR